MAETTRAQNDHSDEQAMQAQIAWENSPPYVAARRLGLDDIGCQVMVAHPDYQRYYRVVPPLTYAAALNAYGPGTGHRTLAAALASLGCDPATLPPDPVIEKVAEWAPMEPSPDPIEAATRLNRDREAARDRMLAEAAAWEAATPAVDGSGAAKAQGAVSKATKRLTAAVRREIDGSSDPRRHSQTPAGRRERYIRMKAERLGVSYEQAADMTRRNV